MLRQRQGSGGRNDYRGYRLHGQDEGNRSLLSRCEDLRFYLGGRFRKSEKLRFFQGNL